jgi:hypothetical protein
VGYSREGHSVSWEAKYQGDNIFSNVSTNNKLIFLSEPVFFENDLKKTIFSRCSLPTK